MVIVVVAMVLMVPVALMQVPAIVVMVVMRMAPVSSRIRRSPPHARNPNISSAVDSPIPINPHIALARHRRTNLVADRRRWSADRN
jgi:hypothetical protein